MVDKVLANYWCGSTAWCSVLHWLVSQLVGSWSWPRGTVDWWWQGMGLAWWSGVGPVHLSTSAAGTRTGERSASTSSWWTGSGTRSWSGIGSENEYRIGHLITLVTGLFGDKIIFCKQSSCKKSQLQNIAHTNYIPVRRVTCSPKKWCWAVAIQNDWKTDYVPYQVRQKYTCMICISILNMDPRLKYLPKGSFYLFMLSFFIMQLFKHQEVQNRQYSIDLFLTKILQFAKAVTSKQSSFTHDHVSSLVYKAIYW